jgi:hypothetical protein
VDGRRAGGRRLRQKCRAADGILRANVPAFTSTAARSCRAHYKNKDLNIVGVFEAVGEFTSGRMTETDYEVERRIPSSGSCGGMYTVEPVVRGARHEPVFVDDGQSGTRDRGHREGNARACSSKPLAAT